MTPLLAYGPGISLPSPPPDGFILLRNKITGARKWHEKDRPYDTDKWEEIK